MANASPFALGLGIGSGQLPYPLINGYAFSYASVELKFNLPSGLKIYKGVKSANYKAPREMTKIWGSHPEPYAITIGKQDYEADVELYLAESNDIQVSLGGGFGDVVFDMHCTYTTPGYPLITDVVEACRLNSPEQSWTMGSTEGLTRKFKLQPMGMKLSGLRILANPLNGLLT